MSSNHLFSDLLPDPTPLSQVVDRVLPSLHEHTAIAGPRVNPWSRIGHVFPPTSDPQEALRLAKLDWSCEKVGLRTADLAPVPDHMAVRRMDDGRVLGVVGTAYEVFNNHEMVNLLADIAGQGRILFECGGAFGRGEIVYVQARLPDHDIVIGEDRSVPWMTISSGHIGNRTMTIMPTLLRCACWNTLKMALAERSDSRRRHSGLSNGFNVRHSREMRDVLADIAAAYAGTLKSLDVTREAYRFLASKSVTTRQMNRYFDAVFPSGPDETDRSRAIAKSRREKLGAIWEGPESRVRGTAGSAFALLNVVTSFVDHFRSTKSEEGSDPIETRLRSATFGSGAQLKEKAWEAALELAA